jgi:hypothetical protein
MASADSLERLARAKASAAKPAIQNELAAQKQRDALYKQGGFQGFEAGFNSTMADFGKSDVGKFLGSLFSGSGVKSHALRGAVGALSLPGEIVGGVAKNAVDFAAKPNFNSLLNLRPSSLAINAANNAFSGFSDPSKQKASSFEQAAQSVINNKMFGAGNPESDALARIIGGTLNIAGDPTTYLGIGAAGKGAQAVDRLAATALARNTLSNPNISIVAPRQIFPEIFESGRFKSQLEMQPNNVNNAKRLQVENDVLGYPLDTPAIDRPIYGAIKNDYNLPQALTKFIPGNTGKFLRLTDPTQNSSSHFGGRNLAFANVPGDRVSGTYTLNDSWLPGVKPFELNNADDAVRASKELIDSLKNTKKLPNYIEAQMRPTKNSADWIESISVPKDTADYFLTGKAVRNAYGKGPEVKSHPLIGQYLKNPKNWSDETTEKIKTWLEYQNANQTSARWAKALEELIENKVPVSAIKDSSPKAKEIAKFLEMRLRKGDRGGDPFSLLKNPFS